MDEFVYCVACYGEVRWSSETAESLRQRLDGEVSDDIEQLEEFLETAVPGEFVSFSTGALAFCRSRSTPPGPPQSLMEIMNESGLLAD